MKIKRTVNLKSCGFEIGFAAGVAWGILNKLAPTKEFVVTSANDSKHGAGSLHYAGRAIDIRTKHLSPDTAIKFFNALKAELERQAFDVVNELDKLHIHVEYQPKLGESFLEITK